MASDDQHLGIVTGGRFHHLGDGGGVSDLTSMGMQVSQPPEMHQVDLSEYEGRAIMVQGHDGGGWIYDAHVIDHAGPILTAVVRRVFGSNATTE